MSVEGMWALRTGDNSNRASLANGGIVVLESQRVFGGDSAMAYVGSFTFASEELTGQVRSFVHATDTVVENVFGMVGSDISADVEFFAQRVAPDRIEGLIWRQDHPEIKLYMELRKITDLP